MASMFARQSHDLHKHSSEITSSIKLAEEHFCGSNRPIRHLPVFSTLVSHRQIIRASWWGIRGGDKIVESRPSSRVL